MQSKLGVQLKVPTQALPVAYQASQGYATQPQQAPPSVSSQSSGQRHFQFQPSGQSMSPQSTPNVSVKSVPRFLEEAWAKGEPSRPPNARQTPPPLPSK